MIGAELELIILNSKSVPISWEDWILLRKDFEAVLHGRDYEENYDILTGAFLGYYVKGIGTIGLDSSASLFEIALDPAENVDEAIGKLRELLDIVESALKRRQFSIFWKSQYPDLISENEYQKRYTRRGLYAVIRKFWQWNHFELYLSASFQPAIDVSRDSLGDVLNAIYVTSPICISIFGGNGTNSIHEYRLLAWEKMITKNERDSDMLGIPGKIKDWRDYISKLLSIRAKILTTEGTYKYGKLVFFDNDILAEQVINGTRGHVIERVIDLYRDEVEVEEIEIKGENYLSQMDWWVFWDARWRFFANKSFIEIRHIGTPRDLKGIRKIFDVFTRIMENSDLINKQAERLGLWDNIREARKSAILTGNVPQNHEKLREILESSRIIEPL